MKQGRSTWRRSWTVTIHTDGSLRTSCVGKAMFECVEMRATRKGGSPTLVAKDGNTDIDQRGGRIYETKKRCSYGH